MEKQQKSGFVVLDRAAVSCKVRYLGNIYTWNAADSGERNSGRLA